MLSRSLLKPSLSAAVRAPLARSTPAAAASAARLSTIAPSSSSSPLRSTAAGLRSPTAFQRAFSHSVARRQQNSAPDAPDNIIDPDQIRPMDRHPAPAPGTDFNVIMVGAGNIMFGSDEGPWNHSFRLEHKFGPRLKVVALIDPSSARANAELAKKRDSFVVSAYKDTMVYANVDEYARAVEGGSVVQPHAAIIGSPPFFRGGPDPGRDLELKLLKNFPSVAMFVEKPVASGQPFRESIEGAMKIAQILEDRGNVVSVGYMLRYLSCVQQMKKIIAENNLTVMATNARYVCAYEAIAKPDWWTKSMSMGPVIEQGTHFCDLSRYFGGDVDISTVFAHSVEFNEAPGKLSKIPIDESKIPEEERIPRVTTASWKYENGAVGQLTHAVALQGQAYSCEFEVIADGFQLKLQDPYNNPTLLVRRPGDDHEEVHKAVDGDDPFFSEIDAWGDVVEGRAGANILSSYLDATRTYELTWAIRNASEKSAAAVRKVAA